MRAVWASVCLILLLQWRSTHEAEKSTNIRGSCKEIKAASPNAASGVYNIKTEKTKNEIEVYCEMGLNGGGYTFLSTRYLQWITNADVQAMFTDKTSFLLRIKTCNGTQPYIVLKQYTPYRHINLKLGFNEHNGYIQPLNLPSMGNPYLYFGFLPEINQTDGAITGVWANGQDYTYRLCGPRMWSYLALFANYREIEPISFQLNIDYPFINEVFGSAKINPSKREMPEDYFYFSEIHFAYCGCHTETDSRLDNKCITSIAIGFR